MKKIFYIFIPVAILCIFASIKGVNAEETTYEADSYTVTIPTEVSFGSSEISKRFSISADLAAYNDLNIEVSSENNYYLKLNNTNYSLKYLLVNGSNSKEISFSTKNSNTSKIFSTNLTAEIESNSGAQVSGTYSDVLTFKMSCVESYPDGQAGLTFDANDGTVETNK